MLIWWKGSAPEGAGVPGAGVPHGILRAPEATLLRHEADVRREAIARADALIAEAQDEAARIVAAARADAEALLQEAQGRIEAACDAGRAEGERQAALAWHERQAGRAVDQAEAVRGLHERLAEVVTSAVERIVQTEGRAALYQRALRSVQALSRSATALTLKVSHADFDAARDGIAAVAELQAAGLAVEVVVDPALPAGSCLFESDMGVVDASLKTQLDALRAAMSRAVRRAVEDAPR
ncbi:type III secretion system stator protein SctL [Mitsuaria sp. GD03876]|uniref:type III secretion system stator protein SctL n=1 Tax=Mitsuaria sp. GD03876 TaxID=2975399 RepID=UPI002449E40E|nr:type III secretion system stator protein SctL [Mitsuaria sp. GD03876]MDH0868403.1 type III secretion system stator protein SctL [Mitsuaria sp. GD03876]